MCAIGAVTAGAAEVSRDTSPRRQREAGRTVLRLSSSCILHEPRGPLRESRDTSVEYRASATVSGRAGGEAGGGPNNELVCCPMETH